MKSASGILKSIGNTPLVRLRHLPGSESAWVWAKIEGFNPGGSVKDRIALNMIEVAELQGTLKSGGTIIEPTSGNTGIGLALVAALKGYRLILTMSETMSIERRQLLCAYGAELVLTPGERGMLGAVEEAERILKKHPDYYMPMQFENPANPDMHRKTTALEIINDRGNAIDSFVAGVGTGGTITGVGEVLRQHNPGIWITAVEPEGSPVLSGGDPGPHQLAGLGAGFYPGILNTKIYDEVIPISDEAAFTMARRLAKEESLLVGISSGAAAVAALQVAARLGSGKNVVVIFPDRGDRYLSTGIYSESSTASLS
ncbi:MAG: cysteine synthase A [Nitrospira sp.]|nr:cysteine synthase A [bacterium]MBL7048655.1 cysteine synthase A [Nitrospira sp.]